jgi:Catalase
MTGGALPPGLNPPPGSRPPKGEEYYTFSNGETVVNYRIQKRLLTDIGCPIINPNASQRIGKQLRSTALIQDINLLEVISHITHERIPER